MATFDDIKLAEIDSGIDSDGFFADLYFSWLDDAGNRQSKMARIRAGDSLTILEAALKAVGEGVV